MRSIIILFGLTLLLSSSSYAQIYPHRTELERQNLKGSIERITDVSHSYSPQLKRWEPLTIISILSFNRQGELLKRGVYISREVSDQNLYLMNTGDSSVSPVLDVTSTIFTSTKGEPFEEYLYAYEEDGRLAGVVERHYNTGQTVKRQYSYEKGKLTFIVSRDSASDRIMEIEQFFYQKDGKPSGSSVRVFDPKDAPVRQHADTLKVPANRIARSYSSYNYSDTATPVIYWRWTFGNDTIVDRQEIKRYLEDGMLSSSITQNFTNAKVTSSQSYLYNVYGDALSSAASFGSDTTYEQMFDYIYDNLDKQKNWTVRRQYTNAARSGSDTAKDSHLLLSRTDRKIEYFK